MNEIKINVNKTITKIAGNELGVEKYNEKIKSICDDIKDQKFKIIFSDNIDFIAPSFIQGFFEDIVLQIGIEGIENNFEFYAKQIPDLKETIIDSLR
ncbi:MAG: hypothetical protein ACLUCH_05410 [Lachnospirales bacterium]